MEVLTGHAIDLDFPMSAPDVVTRGYEKACGPARRIADLVLRRRRGHLDHQGDDVARRAELAVLPGGRDLAEHVLVDVALGVAALHRQVVEHVDDLGEQRRRRDREARIAHVVRVGRALATQRAQERENPLADDREHLARLAVLEVRPAQVRERPATIVVAWRKDRVVEAGSEPIRPVLLRRLQVIEPADEEQVGDLLHHLERIRDAP